MNIGFVLTPCVLGKLLKPNTNICWNLPWPDSLFPKWLKWIIISLQNLIKASVSSNISNNIRYKNNKIALNIWVVEMHCTLNLQIGYGFGRVISIYSLLDINRSRLGQDWQSFVQLSNAFRIQARWRNVWNCSKNKVFTGAALVFNQYQEKCVPQLHNNKFIQLK